MVSLPQVITIVQELRDALGADVPTAQWSAMCRHTFGFDLVTGVGTCAWPALRRAFTALLRTMDDPTLWALVIRDDGALHTALCNRSSEWSELGVPFVNLYLRPIHEIASRMHLTTV